jgi:hypothetical protein
MSKLLINESPLTFQPSLAVAIGLNEAIVLQQVHYWITNTKNKGYEQDGFKWVWNTYAEWRENNFPFWSENTVQRTFASLEDMGLLISIQPMKSRYDRTKYYRIDYPKLEVLDDPKLVSSLNESETTHRETMPLEWKIAHGETVTVKDTDNTDEALHDFERTFGFGQLPWRSNTVWDKFTRWIISQAPAGWFSDYVKWREGEGKYKAFSNKKIRENPQAFIDTGYPEYEAGKMYRKTDEERPEYKRYVDPREGLDFVPNPKAKK